MEMDESFWKAKLAAFLHDTPSKALSIWDHENRSIVALRQAGFTDSELEQFYKATDHFAAAADRLPFPSSRSSGLSCSFDGVENSFVHPLSGDKFKFHSAFSNVDQVFEVENTLQPVLSAVSEKQLASFGLWKARFFTHWRLWQKFSTEKDYRLSFLPADTRICDHSIWTHMQIVSALQGCVTNNRCKPAFLKFQLGPVQEFIQASRSTRDLWSGSYLLSWLMATGLKALSLAIGPDSVIYPNLRGVAVFDVQLRDELWKRAFIGNRSVWYSLKYPDLDILHPNLPNVFLAVVPEDRAHELAKLVSNAIRSEWKKISVSVWDSCVCAGLTHDEPGITEVERKTKFDNQIDKFLNVSFQVTPWVTSLNDALNLATDFDTNMPVVKAKQRLDSIIDMATKDMPFEHRDSRYYEGGVTGPKTVLNNVGLGWSIMMAFNSWQLDAVRQSRVFDANCSGGWYTGVFNNKDVLNGRDEAVAGGKKWNELAKNLGYPWKQLFKHNDWMCASILVKRVWHMTYLEKNVGLKTDTDHFPMPNTCSIASHLPFSATCDDDIENLEVDEKYFAVLALDGDSIGKWVSGENTPKISSQLADYCSNGERLGAKVYFENTQFKDFLNCNRPVSPSFSLQFSEALSNFSTLFVRGIVENYLGRLIYAGGDDVLALLPADTSLRCAQALRSAFKGQAVIGLNGAVLFKKCETSFISNGMLDGNNKVIPFLVPGSACDVSVGVAVAHCKSPLQAVVRAAQSAERSAKSEYGRSAIVVSLFKRSGEIICWGSKWDNDGLVLFDLMSRAIQTKIVSGKFPYKFVDLLSPYISFNSTADFDVVGVIQAEFKHVLSCQRGENFNVSDSAKLALELDNYLTKLDLVKNQDKVKFLISRVVGLCEAVAFINRISV